MDLSWLSSTVAGNEVWRLFALFASVLAALIGGRILNEALTRFSRTMASAQHPVFGTALAAIRGAIGLFSLIVGLRIGLTFLLMTDRMRGMVSTSFGVLVTVAVAWAAYLAVDVLAHWLATRAERTESKLDDMLVPLVRKSLRVTIVLLALLQIATLLSDKPVTSLLAGLGIGSLAVALAAQDTIKNFFGSLVILADKPFEVGERIVVDSVDGAVEQVGFRSTRIRTLEGHLVTIPNGELANKNIQNIGKRRNIRRLFNVTVPYDTPPGKVQRAVAILKEILQDHEGMDPEFPPRVTFNELNADSLNIQVIYWYSPPDWWKYLAFTERVNHELLRRFNDEGIEFAFPTQTLFLAGDPRRPLRGGPDPLTAAGT